MVEQLCLNPCCSGRWSHTWLRSFCSFYPTIVLILIVVDDGLVHFANFKSNSQSSNVLILIVMEDGLVQVVQHLFRYSSYVLILIVVDNGLVPATAA